jgi:hypothetical protein
VLAVMGPHGPRAIPAAARARLAPGADRPASTDRAGRVDIRT